MSLQIEKSTSKKKEIQGNNIEDMDYYIKRSEVLENDLFKLQMQNKKLEDGLKKLQELNTLYAKVTNMILIRI